MNKLLIGGTAEIEKNSVKEVPEEEEQRIVDCLSDISSATSAPEIFSYNSNTREGEYQY